MLEARALPRGWPIVAWTAAALVLMIAAVLALAGGDEAGLRMVIRATARTSCVLFLAAFVASALHHAWPSPATAWLLANRRYVGVSFAVSHLLHLLAIADLAGWSAQGLVATAGMTTTVVGGIGYLLIAAMTATSFDRTAAWLGARRWRRLHTIGAYYVWLVFFLSFAPRVASSPLHLPFGVAVVAAPVLRWRARRGGAAMATAGGLRTSRLG
jgi:hypothetical protein